MALFDRSGAKQHGYPVAIIVAVLGTLYALTAARTVTMEDSSEFLLSALYLGMPHPPGYPLYVLIGHLFSFLPLGPVALRITLLSSAAAVGACVLLYFIATQLKVSRWPACAGALLLGVSKTFWSQAVIAEVYTLNVCLFAAALLMVLYFSDHPTHRRGFFLGLLLGLALADHWPLTVLAGPSLIIFLWNQRVAVLRVSPLIGLGLLLGLSPYLFLFAAPHFSDFIFIAPLRDMQDFFAYVGRREYAQNDQTPYATQLDRLRFYGEFLWMLGSEFSLIGAPLIAAGLYALWKKYDRRIFFALLFALLSSSILLPILRRSSFDDLSAELYQVYQLIPLWVGALSIAVGYQFIAQSRQHWRSQLITLGIVQVVLSVMMHFEINNMTHDTFANDYAHLLLNDLPANAVLMVHGDADAGPTGYVHYVLGVRPDVLVVSQVSAFFPDKIFNRQVDIVRGDHLTKLLAFINNSRQNGRRVFTTSRIDYFDEVGANFPLHYVPYGLYFEITDKEGNGTGTPELVSATRHFLDNVVDDVYPEHFTSHRQHVMQGLCYFMLLNEQEHPVLESRPECNITLAQWANAYLRNFPLARTYFLKMMHHPLPMTLPQRVEIARQYLVNQLQWSNTIDPKEPLRLQLLQDGIDETRDLALQYTLCKNKLALNILQIRAQVNVNLDVTPFREQFSNCQDHAVALAQIQERR